MGGHRREGGASSARSLLLTVLGEFVLPQQAPVWTGALVSALTGMSVEEKTARQALSRLATEGLLVAERQGRRVRWELTPSATELLVEGTERIYGFGGRIQNWDGRWLVVALSVPETRRAVATSSSNPPQLGRSRVADTGRLGYSGCRQGTRGGGDPRVPRYRVLLLRWILRRRRRPAPAGRCVVASRRRGTVLSRVRSGVCLGRGQHAGGGIPVAGRVVGHWRRVPFLDPGLPTELLPANWPRQSAVEAFHHQHDRWHASAQSHWRMLMATAEDQS